MNSKFFYLFLLICLTRLVGFALLPVLLKTSPLLLIILSPFLPHLILSSTLISMPLFLFSGILISFIQCSIGYEFGRRHGTRGLDWCKKYNLISDSKIEFLTGWIRYSAPLVLFVIPGPLVAMVAGVSNLKARLFYSVMIPSQILWVVACYILGSELEIYLDLVKAFIFEHWPLLTFGLVSIKLLQMRIKK